MVTFAIKTPPQHGRWADFLDVWRAADDIDLFESAWTMDHFYPLTPPLDGTHLESWAVLAAMAQATKRLRLGCMVNGMHHRHPAVTANAAATLDHISGGRFYLGLGAGWFEAESNAYGLRLGSLKERFDRFDEGLEVITSLLTTDYTDFAGRYFQLTQARCEPKPVQSPLPIVIGGRGPTRTLPAAARWAHMWDLAGPASPAEWKATSALLDERCAEIGRSPNEIRRSVHLMWPEDAAPQAMAATALEYGAAGVDLVIFS
ncbi:MAG TPA: TIGR03560 family F420-dependent LLM class oxidoreductase, partial [Ilumatobacteraceae bacterium]|nr:TIGR03560 family F420-dependent LLM class oxidoreductase [Ilumatobacteraceae bacterium]